jgi:ATP-dependent Clp protease ATP-binding subunit ClpA
MISPELEGVLHRCFVEAIESRHRVLTVNHLVLEALKQPSAIQYLTDRSLDVERLRSSVEAKVLATETAPDNGDYAETVPTHEFQQLIERAINTAHVNGKGEVSVVGILKLALNAEA